MASAHRHSKHLTDDRDIDVIRNEDEIEAPRAVHQKTISGVFHSKREQHNFLAGECDIYLPDYENASGYVRHTITNIGT